MKKQGMMKFCAECNNLLYPKPVKRVLQYACRRCDYQEVADNNCVYRHEVARPNQVRLTDLKDLPLDSTYPRIRIRCPVCNHGEAAYKLDFSEDRMQKIHVCCNQDCRHIWRIDGF